MPGIVVLFYMLYNNQRYELYEQYQEYHRYRINRSVCHSGDVTVCHRIGSCQTRGTCHTTGDSSKQIEYAYLEYQTANYCGDKHRNQCNQSTYSK